MPPRAKALNSIRIKWIATHWNRKLVKQGKIFYFGSTIRLLSIKRFHQVLQFVQNTILQNERKTNSVLRLLLTLTM
jgi:hypothetical protein